MRGKPAGSLEGPPETCLVGVSQPEGNLIQFQIGA